MKIELQNGDITDACMILNLDDGRTVIIVLDDIAPGAGLKIQKDGYFELNGFAHSISHREGVIDLDETNESPD